jgi:hypothetical protein
LSDLQTDFSMKLIATISLLIILLISAKPKETYYVSQITSYPFVTGNEIFRRDATSSTGWEWYDGSVWADMALAGGTGIVNLSGGAASSVSYIGKVFTNPSGSGNDHALTLTGGNTIRIEKCLFYNTDGLAIYFNNCTSFIIVQNFITNCKRGILLQDCDAGNFKVHANQFANMVWDRLEGGDIAGQFLQISITSNAPNVEVTSNRGENFFGESFNEDLFNFFTSGGQSGDPLLVKGNITRGGSWSTSGGGFVAGDVGGSYYIFDSNYLVRPGRYTMQVAVSGSNATFTNNKVYSDQLPWNAVSYYFPSCSAVTLGSTNYSNYKNSAGTTVNYTVSSCGSPGAPSTGQSLASMNIPDPLLSYMSDDDLWYLRSLKWDSASLIANGDTYGTEDGSTTCNVRRPSAVVGVSGSGSSRTLNSGGSVAGTGGSGTNTITGYNFVFVSGPNTPTITTPTSSSTTVTGLVNGTYRVRVEVEQTNGQHSLKTYDAAWADFVVSGTSVRYKGRIF